MDNQANGNQGEIIKQFPEKIKDDTLEITRVVKKGNGQEVQFFYRCGHLNNEPTFCKFFLPFKLNGLDLSNANSKEDIIRIIENSQKNGGVKKDLNIRFNIATLEQIKINTYETYYFRISWHNSLKELDTFFVENNLNRDYHPLHSFIFFLKEKFKNIENKRNGITFSRILLKNKLETKNNSSLKDKLEEFIDFLDKQQTEQKDNIDGAIEERFSDILSLTKPKTEIPEKQDIKLEGYKQQTQNTDNINKMNMTKIIEEKSNNILSLTKQKTETPKRQDMQFEGNEINNDSCGCKGCSLFSCCRPCGCCKGS